MIAGNKYTVHNIYCQCPAHAGVPGSRKPVTFKHYLTSDALFTTAPTPSFVHRGPSGKRDHGRCLFTPT
jgi:hypothetical protein